VSFQPVIRNAAFCLAHVPELVRYGSKPRREIAEDAAFEQRLSSALRSFAEAVSYAPNQTFVGNLSPEQLARIDRPWYETHVRAHGHGATGRFGEIIDQATFYGILKQADVLEPNLVELDQNAVDRLRGAVANHRVLSRVVRSDWEPLPSDRVHKELQAVTALGLNLDGEVVGLVRRDCRAEGRDDKNLSAHTLLEGLCAKATGAAALQWLFEREETGQESIDYIISCGEEATGDRYQRGGGGMAKAVGEMCGCVNASGMDVKNFCAAPASALITAGALVAAGLYQRIAVVAGGSLAKLGMKSSAFLRDGLPVLDDCLASHAFLVTRDDGVSPILHLEPGSVGAATIGSSTADEAVYRQLLLEPLAALDLTMNDIDKYAPELHNPEIMQHSGSGDVVHKNFRMIAAMAVRAGVINREGMQAFINRVGMVGFAPTQGHIPSGVAYIGHALDKIGGGALQRVMILSKASLFLNRLTDLYDGVSFVLESNPRKNS
jgi:betaine reductase